MWMCVHVSVYEAPWGVTKLPLFKGLRKGHESTEALPNTSSVWGVVHSPCPTAISEGLHASPVTSPFREGCMQPLNKLPFSGGCVEAPCKSPFSGRCVQPPCNPYFRKVATSL